MYEPHLRTPGSFSDLELFSQVLLDVYAISDLDAFPRAALRLVHKLVPGDQLTYVESDLPKHFVFIVDPPSPISSQRADALKRHILHHPIYIQRDKGDDSAWKVSDFITQEELHRTPLYQNSMKLAGYEYLMSVALPAQLPLHVSIAIGRASCDFTERERMLLNMLRPHLGRARETAEWLTLLRRLETNRALIIADLQHQVQFASDSALASLADFYGGQSLNQGLPVQVREWAEEQLQRADQKDNFEFHSEPVVMRRGPCALTLTFMSRGKVGNQYAIFLQQSIDPVPTALQNLNLRPRETDVLYWVLKGKSDREIADLLTVSVRTVEKHLENIYARLDVHNRTAAVARAVELMTSLSV